MTITEMTIVKQYMQRGWSFAYKMDATIYLTATNGEQSFSGADYAECFKQIDKHERKK